MTTKLEKGEMIQVEINKLVDSFKEYLLNSELKDNIAKIILFGSHAKGVGSPESDVDILIFTIDGSGAEEAIMNKVYDFMIERNVALEVLISGIDEFLLHQNYFIYNITHYGMEIYSMEKEKIKAAMLKDIKDLAEEYFESAEEVLRRNRVRLAVDGAYNAVELAAKGLILLKQDDLPGSHGGMVSLFGQLYVKTKEVGREIGRGLNTALKLRNMARYKPHALLSEEDAKDVLDLAERVIETLSKRIDD